MKLKSLTIAAGLALATPAVTQSPEETITPNFEHAIPNIPGKSLKAVGVDYSPAGASPAHSHAKSAFIYGYAVSSAIETQVSILKVVSDARDQSTINTDDAARDIGRPLAGEESDHIGIFLRIPVPPERDR